MLNSSNFKSYHLILYTKLFNVKVFESLKISKTMLLALSTAYL